MGAKPHHDRDSSDHRDEAESPLAIPRRGYVDAAFADIANSLERERDGDTGDNWMYGHKDGPQQR